jgi:hypothetical protein
MKIVQQQAKNNRICIETICAISRRSLSPLLIAVWVIGYTISSTNHSFYLINGWCRINKQQLLSLTHLWFLLGSACIAVWYLNIFAFMIMQSVDRVSDPSVSTPTRACRLTRYTVLHDKLHTKQGEKHEHSRRVLLTPFAWIAVHDNMTRSTNIYLYL